MYHLHYIVTLVLCLMTLGYCQKCADERDIGRFIELEQNATTEAIREIQNLVSFQISSNNVSSNNATSRNGTAEESLYSNIAASLNITETDDSRNDFVEALDVITDAYFKACYGPENEKPSPMEGPQLVSELVTLLENRTDFTLMREVYGKLLCLEEFAGITKRAVDLETCSQATSIMKLYKCLDDRDPEIIACIFNISPLQSCRNSVVAFSGRSRSNCIAFVVDTTGSMADEIAAARDIITNFIQSEEDIFTLCYILVAFNDYGYSISESENNLDLEKIYSANHISNANMQLFTVYDYDHRMVDVHPVSDLLVDVNNLTASGGGDCPEFGMTGIKKAIELLIGVQDRRFPNGKHNIIVLTDASAKDDSLSESIIDKLKENSRLDITVHFFFSGGGCIDGSFGQYPSLASATGGHVVSQIDGDSFPEFVEFIKNSASSLKKRSASLCESFIISLFVSQFTTLITTEQPSVTFTAPDGTNTIINKPDKSFDIHTVTDPQTGLWEACVNTGAIELSINKELNLDFTINYLENDSTGQLLPTFNLPSTCQTAVFVLEIVQQLYISFNHSLHIDYIDGNGQLLTSATISECQGILTSSVTLPSQNDIRYQLRGRDTDGNEFSHLGDFVSLNDASTITVTTVTEASIIVSPGKESAVWLLIRNDNNQTFNNVSTQIVVPSDFNVSVQSDLLFSLQQHESQVVQFSIIGSSSLPAGMPFNITFIVDDNCTITNFSFLAYVRPSVLFEISNRTTTSIVFSWSEQFLSVGNIAMYTLTFGTVQPLSIITVDLDNQTYIYTLDNLSSYQLIYFTIVAKDIKGMELAGSGPVAVRTNESKPSRVSSLEVEVTSLTTATVLWSEPTQINGVLLYYITIVNGSDGYYKVFNLSYIVLTIPLSQLNEYIRYTVTVVAATSAGEGDAYTKVFYTSEGVPKTAPSAFQYEILSASSVELSWSPPLINDRRGFIVGYVITNRKILNELLTEVIGRFSVGSDTIAYTLSELDPHQRYEVTINAETSVGIGQTSPSIIFYTNIGVPIGGPTDIQYKILSSTALSFSWNPPVFRLRRGFITEYILIINDTSSAEMRNTQDPRVITYTLPHSHTYLNTSDSLTEFGVFSVSLAAATSAGVGLAVFLQVSIVTGVPSLPLNVSAEMFNDTAVILEWQYPTSPNGIIEGFVICYKYELTQEGDYYNESVVRAPMDTTSKIIADIKSQKQYMFKIAAENQAGIGEGVVVNITLNNNRDSQRNYEAVAASTSVIGIIILIAIVAFIVTVVSIVIVLHFKKRNKQIREKASDFPLTTTEKQLEVVPS